jgi:hypothetical protein
MLYNSYIVNKQEQHNMTDYSTHPAFTRHGGAYDRGAADSYYGRGREPHYFVGATFQSTLIEQTDMSAEEIAAYMQGYNDNEKSGGKKDY